MNDTQTYLIRFLIGDTVFKQENVPKVGYTADVTQFHAYDLVIVPSGFFDEENYGKRSSLPSESLPQWEEIPILYGTPQVERIGKTIVLHADLIASAYFLLTRYEEMVRRDVRDAHGRFPGKESLPYRADFIHRPIVDEYRLMLQKYLQDFIPAQALIQPRLNKIELTHDVDEPFLYRSWKGFLRSLLHRRGIRTSLKGMFGKPENDPYYTFPWLIQQNQALIDSCENVCCTLFFKANGNTVPDKPRYNLKHKDIRQIAECFRQTLGADVGLHASYQVGKNPSLIKKEKERLEAAGKITVLHNRHHFLSSREPEDMEYLLQAGIFHDYTMGYADVSGFRLGTSHVVRWINPTTRQLTDLQLHPLTIMDCTLEDEEYMRLTFEEASNYCRQLIDNARKVGGNICLLWHNSLVAENKKSYLRKLYASILDYLIQEPNDLNIKP